MVSRQLIPIKPIEYIRKLTVFPISSVPVQRPIFSLSTRYISRSLQIEISSYELRPDIQKLNLLPLFTAMFRSEWIDEKNIYEDKRGLPASAYNKKYWTLLDDATFVTQVTVFIFRSSAEIEATNVPYDNRFFELSRCWQ